MNLYHARLNNEDESNEDNSSVYNISLDDSSSD